MGSFASAAFMCGVYTWVFHTTSCGLHYPVYHHNQRTVPSRGSIHQIRASPLQTRHRALQKKRFETSIAAAAMSPRGRSSSSGSRPQRRQRSHMLLLFVAAAALSALSAADAELVAVWGVTRHGTRNVLPKSASLQEDESSGGPTLLPRGAAASRAAGGCSGDMWGFVRPPCFLRLPSPVQRKPLPNWQLTPGAAFRARYLSPGSCDLSSTCLAAPGAGSSYGLLGAPGAAFNNYNTLIQSSALDRTLLSANAFLAGAFPPQNATALGPDASPASQLAPPVYSVADSEDWKVRGYTKCASYERRLADWFGSEEFRAKEQATRAAREAVGTWVPGLDVSLAKWWNGAGGRADSLIGVGRCKWL